MADEIRKNKDEQPQTPTNRPQDGNKLNDRESDWLVDQMGEDRNLSGSSTYRTLPDQKEEDNTGRDDSDAQERQSRR